MIRGLHAMALACCIAGSAHAGLDMAITHGGGNAPSGSRDEMLTDQDDAILLEVNNDISSRGGVITDPASPLSTEDRMDSESVGQIMSGANAPEAGGTGSKAIYDRLNVRAVLRLLLYDQPEQAGYRPEPVITQPALVREPANGPAGGSGGGGNDDAPQFTAIPEPTTCLLMIGAAGIAYGRRRRKTV